MDLFIIMRYKHICIINNFNIINVIFLLFRSINRLPDQYYYSQFLYYRNKWVTPYMISFIELIK